MAEFRASAQLLSSEHPRMITEYPKQWVALHGGVVRATSRTLRGLLSALERRAIPRESVVVRFIEKDQRTMVL